MKTKAFAIYLEIQSYLRVTCQPRIQVTVYYANLIQNNIEAGKRRKSISVKLHL